LEVDDQTLELQRFDIWANGEQWTWAKATKNSCSLVRLTAGSVGSLPCFDVQSLYA